MNGGQRGGAVCRAKFRWPHPPNRRKITCTTAHRKVSTVAQLDVNPADLLRAADTYTGLAERTAQLSPRAAAEVVRIADTHGPMGYPAAVGIATGIANTEPPLTAKTADFQTYSQRFTEHAATYTTEDHDAARRYRAPDAPTLTLGNGNSAVDRSLFTPVANMISPPTAGYVIIWCTPLAFGFSCEYLYPGGGYSRYWSQWDLTGGRPI